MSGIEVTTELRRGSVALAEDVTALYLKAVELRRLDVAESLLEILEKLATVEPLCKHFLDRADAEIAGLPPPGCS